MKQFIFGLLLGGGVGAGITYFVMKKQFEKKEEEIRASIRKELKEYYERKQEEEDEAKVKHVKAIPDKPVVSREYHELTRPYDRAEMEHPTEEDYIAETEAEERVQEALEASHDKPKLLNVESFGELTNYETESLTYYVEDQTLVHEDGSLVDDEAFLLGDALDRYDWRDDDNDQAPLYVRNYKLQRDYEVVKVMAEYPGDQ